MTVGEICIAPNTFNITKAEFFENVAILCLEVISCVEK